MHRLAPHQSTDGCKRDCLVYPAQRRFLLFSQDRYACQRDSHRSKGEAGNIKGLESTLYLMIPYIKNKMKNRNARIINLILLCCPIIQNSMAQEPASQQHTLQRSQDLHALIINASPGWIISKIYTNQGEYSWLSGMGFELSYRYLTSNGYGFSIEYAHNETTLSLIHI